jgi:hypothetical protein
MKCSRLRNVDKGMCAAHNTPVLQYPASLVTLCVGPILVALLRISTPGKQYHGELETGPSCHEHVACKSEYGCIENT